MDKSPSITVIYSCDNKKALKEILAGIEEEGVPYEVKKEQDAAALKLACLGSEESLLEIGIGLSSREACTHIRSMSGQNCLFKITLDSEAELRKLGANTARYVKGIPFKL